MASGGIDEIKIDQPMQAKGQVRYISNNLFEENNLLGKYSSLYTTLDTLDTAKNVSLNDYLSYLANLTTIEAHLRNIPTHITTLYRKSLRESFQKISNKITDTINAILTNIRVKISSLQDKDPNDLSEKIILLNNELEQISKHILTIDSILAIPKLPCQKNINKSTKNHSKKIEINLAHEELKEIIPLYLIELKKYKHELSSTNDETVSYLLSIFSTLIKTDNPTKIVNPQIDKSTVDEHLNRTQVNLIEQFTSSLTNLVSYLKSAISSNTIYQYIHNIIKVINDISTIVSNINNHYQKHIGNPNNLTLKDLKLIHNLEKDVSLIISNILLELENSQGNYKIDNLINLLEDIIDYENINRIIYIHVDGTKQTKLSLQDLSENFAVQDIPYKLYISGNIKLSPSANNYISLDIQDNFINPHHYLMTKITSTFSWNDKKGYLSIAKNNFISLDIPTQSNPIDEYITPLSFPQTYYSISTDQDKSISEKIKELLTLTEPAPIHYEKVKYTLEKIKILFKLIDPSDHEKITNEYKDTLGNVDDFFKLNHFSNYKKIEDSCKNTLEKIEKLLELIDHHSGAAYNSEDSKYKIKMEKPANILEIRDFHSIMDLSTFSHSTDCTKEYNETEL